MASKKAQALFAAARQRHGDAEADQGLGSLGEWPPEGDVIVIVTGLVENEDDKFLFRDGKEKKNFPAMSFQFTYETWDEESPEEEGLKWKGKPFIMPYDQDTINLPDGQLQRISIDRNRFAGHLKTITGMEVDSGDESLDMAEAVDMVKEKLESSQVIVEAYCEYDGKYKTEKLRKLIAG